MVGEDEQSIKDHIAYLKTIAEKGSSPDPEVLAISMEATAKRRESIRGDLLKVLEEFPIMELEGMVRSLLFIM